MKFPAPQGYIAVGSETYSKERGYGWFGKLKGTGWHMEAHYSGGTEDILLATSVENSHAPRLECSGFRINVPNGEYILELGMGSPLFCAVWDIHIVDIKRNFNGSRSQKTKRRRRSTLYDLVVSGGIHVPSG